MKNKIITYFKTNPNLVITSKALSKKLKVKKKDLEYFKSILYSLLKEGFLVKSGKRYKLNNSSGKKQIGTLQLVNDQNYGFVIFKNNNLNDVFISEKHLHTALDGDQVEVALFAKRKGKNLEGQIVTIVELSLIHISEPTRPY
mgnify:CR=1 FL=1